MEQIVERQIIEAMTVKRQRCRKGISLSNKKEKNDKSDTRNKIDVDQVGNDNNLL